MSFKYQAQKVGANHYVLPPCGDMKVEAHAFLSDDLYAASEEETWIQIAHGAAYEGVIGAYLMPDCHRGYGVPVGSVVVTEDTVIQCGSGYDISCGVLYMKANLTAKSVRSRNKRERWVSAVSKRVALGVGSDRPDLMRRIKPAQVDEVLRYGAKSLGINEDLCERRYIPIPETLDLSKIDKAYSKVQNQLGSVGGGNHFIELQVDRDDGSVWIMVHCGSRGYGWQTANHYFYEGARLRGIPSKRREDSWLRMDEPLGKEYWAYHNSAANFAVANRHVIVEGVREATQEVFGADLEVYYEISHNLVQEETLALPDGTHKKGFVHRKGATRAFPAGHPDLVGTAWEKTGHPCLIPGCLGKGTRILMANGFYRDIECVKVGDYVISGSGKAVPVTAVHDRGEKATIQYRSNQFWSSTNVTLDHKHLIGDISGDRVSPRRTDTRVAILSRSDRAGNSKIRWCAIEETPKDFTLLAPREIDFLLPDPQTLNIAGHTVEPSYELGYVFGTYLGDGSSYVSESTKHNWKGQVSWAFGPNETEIADKLASCLWEVFGYRGTCYPSKVCLVVAHNPELARFLLNFGKTTEKHLPEHLLVGNLFYLRGIYDGLVDSDGHDGGTKKFTNTSTACIELFSVVHHILFGYFPSISVRPPTAGGLTNCETENCNTSYRATALKLPPLISKYQLIDPIGLVYTNHRQGKASDFQRDLTMKMEATYDLTLAGDDPSFIANNVVVHNSMYEGAAILFPKEGAYKSACSVNHGSGRVLGRGDAKRKLEHKQDRIDAEMATVQRTFNGVQIEGIVGNHKKTPLDECGAVYKDLDAVLEVLEENGIAEVKHRLYPVCNLKGID